MAIKRCPNPNPECPWFRRPTPASLRSTQEHGCFSDSDHKVPQWMARRAGATALERAYILDTRDNREQLCRWEHDEKTAQGGEIIPPADYMLEALATEVAQGIIHLSESKRRQVFGRTDPGTIAA